MDTFYYMSEGCISYKCHWSKSGFSKLGLATPFGVAKLNIGVAKHSATMTSQSKWGRQ